VLNIYIYLLHYFIFILLPFLSLLFYCISMQPGTRISFGINKVLSYLITDWSSRELKHNVLLMLCYGTPPALQQYIWMMFFKWRYYFPPPKNPYLIVMGGLGAPVTLGAVLSGALAPGRVSKGKVVPGEGPD